MPNQSKHNMYTCRDAIIDHLAACDAAPVNVLKNHCYNQALDYTPEKFLETLTDMVVKNEIETSFDLYEDGPIVTVISLSGMWYDGDGYFKDVR